MIVVTILPFTQFYRFNYFFYPGSFRLIALVFQRNAFDVCFLVSDAYCPNFWAIKLEVVPCSAAIIQFNCYFQLQQRFLLLEPPAKAGNAVLCFCETSRDPAIQVDEPVLREVLAPWTFVFSVTPNTPAVGETIQHIFWHKDPLQDAFGESSSSS